MREFFDSLFYHGIVALAIGCIAIGAVPFLKVLAGYLPGQGLQEAIAAS